MSNTVRVGFLHVEPPKELPEGDVKKFIENSPQDVIVMTFGSHDNMREMSRDKKLKFLKVFSEIKFSVIWKFEYEDEELEVPANVHLAKWLPLADALAHPKVKIFITHGGLNSAFEAIDREVPMIVFPLSYDQPGNAKMMVKNGIALELDLNTFTEAQLSAAIHEISSNSSYKESVKQLKRLAYDQPMAPRELAVWHIEHVLRLGKLSYADYPGRNLALWQSHFMLTFFLWICGTFLLIRVATKVIDKLFKNFY